MLELALVGLIGILIMIFFYKQAICEYRLNQVEWEQRVKVEGLLSEKVPIVLRGRPATAFWTQEDIFMRNIYDQIPIFENSEIIFSNWTMAVDKDIICPWQKDHGRLLAGKNMSGFDCWAERMLSPLLGWRKWVTWSEESCWLGGKGLMKLSAPWTAIICTQGEALVSLLTENYEKSLPSVWEGRFPSDISTYDTPFAGEIKYMDIILRAGTVLIVPAHWLISWRATDKSEVYPMICMVEWHSAISKIISILKNK